MAILILAKIKEVQRDVMPKKELENRLQGEKK
jgi:hypothetical protein